MTFGSHRFRFTMKNLIAIYCVIILALNKGHNWLGSISVHAMDPSSSSSKMEISEPSQSIRDACDSSSCGDFAKNFLMNLIGDPCTDFYDYVCLNNPKTLFSEATARVEDNIKSLIKTNDNLGNENLARLRNLYSSCKSTGGDNLKTLLELIKQLGGFPLGGSRSGWDDQKPFDWTQMTSEFRQIGLKLNQFFDFGIKANNLHYRLKVGVTSKKFSTKLKTVEDIIETLYPETEFGQIYEKLRKLENFRSDLRKITRSSYGQTVKYDFAALQSEIPDIDWTKLLAGIIGDDGRIHGNQMFIVGVERVKPLADLIRRTNPEVLANHMMLSIIDEFLPYINSVGLRLREAYPTPRCTQVLKDNLGLALSIEYYKAYVDLRTVNIVSDMVDTLRDEFKMMIDEAEWISESSTKSVAKAKIDNLKFDLGISEKLLQPATDEFFYQGLSINPYNPIHNLLNLNRCKYDAYFNQILNNRIDSFEWIEYDYVHGARTNAFYHAPGHRVYLLAGMMGPLFVDASRVADINFGVLGTILAHQMLRVFDLRKGLSDANNIECKWCDPKTEARYKKKVGCLVNQYDGLEVQLVGWKVDGKKTLFENVADNAALELAYRAFKRWTSRQKKMSNLLELESYQLFWASYGVAFCRHLNNNKRQIDAYLIGAQISPKFRVNIPLINSENFNKELKCQVGSPMNPKDKCTIWS